MGYHHLTTDERCQIYALKSTGSLQKEIARHLGVSEPTISRELKRNSGQKGYRHKQASEKAAKRRHNASHRPKKMTVLLYSL